MKHYPRKLGLTLHLVASLGWLGSVAGFLSLAILGIMNADDTRVRAAYLSMDTLAWAVILPFSIATFVTGVLQSLGTTWGLFRHYWVLIKLLITVVSTMLLLLHMRPIGHVASLAAERNLSSGDLRSLRIQLLVNAGAAIAALLVSTVLAVYKPKGLTRYGWRKLKQVRPLPSRG